MATKTQIKAKKAKTIQPQDETKSETLKSLRETVSDSHGNWIENRPKATLGDLLSFLNGVQEEFFNFNDDDILAEISGDLGDAYEYLGEFEDFKKPINSDGELPTVGYRAENVGEDIGVVEDLIELVGEAFKVRTLPTKAEMLKGRFVAIAGNVARNGRFRNVTVVPKILKALMKLPFCYFKDEVSEFMKANPGQPCSVPSSLAEESFGWQPSV